MNTQKPNRTLLIEFKKENISAVSQSAINVLYEGEIVGEYFTDILISDKIILEIKAAKNVEEEHETQLLNYLKATNIEVGLLLNYSPKPNFKRKAFDNTRK